MTAGIRVFATDDPRHAAAAAHLHQTRIGTGFLSSLGPAFLKTLYRRVGRDPGSFLVVAELDGEAVGFVAGTESTRHLYRQFLTRDWARVATAAAWPLLRALPTTLESLRYGGGSNGTADLPPAELLAIAVAPAATGRGVGSELMRAFLAELSDRSVDSARVVVAAENQRAIALYRAHGFQPASTISVHRGATSMVLVWRRSG